MHWRQAFVSTYPKLTILWLVFVLVVTLAVGIRQAMVANEPYPGQYATAEFTTVGLATIVGWAVCKIIVQILYRMKDESREEMHAWDTDQKPPPIIARIQWAFHTLAVPLNWVALFIYSCHIGRGFRIIDITFTRSMVQAVLMTMNLFIGKEPFVEMHLVYVFTACLIYGIAMTAAFGSTYPISDVFIGMGLSIPSYAIIYFIENATELTYKGDVFYKNAMRGPVHPTEEDEEEDATVQPKP